MIVVLLIWSGKFCGWWQQGRLGNCMVKLKILMVEMASVVLCMKLLSALHLLQEWSPHQVAKTLMPLLTFVLILPCQQWIRHLRRHVLETWCPTDLHPGFALAWGGVWEALRATLEAHGERHDRVLCEKVGAHERARRVSHKSSQDAKPVPP